MNDEQLDSMLRQWAERQAPSPQHLDELRRQVVSAANNPDIRGGAPKANAVRIWPALLYAGIAAAAAIVAVGAGLLWTQSPAPTPGGDILLAAGNAEPPPGYAKPRPGSAEPQLGTPGYAKPLPGSAEPQLGTPGYAEPQLGHSHPASPAISASPALLLDAGAISPEMLRRNSALYLAMRELFAGEFRWAAQSNGDIAIGIEPSPSAGRGGQPLLVRLVLVSREPGAPTWDTEWEAEVLAAAEEMLEVAPGSPADNTLRIWVYPVDEGKFVVDTGIEFADSHLAAANHSDLVADGATVEIASSQAGGREYRVLQTVKTIATGESRS